jgi:hypothetical protein
MRNVYEPRLPQSPCWSLVTFDTKNQDPQNFTGSLLCKRWQDTSS